MRFYALILALLITQQWTGANAHAEVLSTDTATRLSENIPEIPDALNERLLRYQNTRSASVNGWLPNNQGLLISTRFGQTNQVHWVKSADGARHQLTFYNEPIAEVAPNPVHNGFVFSKDSGGSEFWQLYWFDLNSREVTLWTDGKSRNESLLWSSDGSKLAWSSTARNGKDTDVWVRDFTSGEAKPVITEGGAWYATGFSPDGKKLLAQRYVSANETQPIVVDLTSGKLRTLYDAKRKVAFDGFIFAPHGHGAYYASDESGEFRELRYHDFPSDKITSLTSHIPWDIEEFKLARDGSHLAFIANEDGFGVLHVLDTTTGKEVALPELPKGIAFNLNFSADSKHLAFSLNSASSPSDVYAIDLSARTLTRWTESEVGGLDTSKFTLPELVHYPTFDKVKGKARQIPAFYYKPQSAGPHPVVIQIHGGPEAQSLPSFNANTQFLVNELGVAVIVPNVRGSSGYGKNYLTLDNGYKREDSVKDIGTLLDWIAKQTDLDAKRVGVYGGSYGGYMVLSSLTHYSDRLRGGIDVVGISNFVTFLENTEDYRKDLRRVEYGDERDQKMRAFQNKISPTTQADKIKTPLFVAMGANDPRVPASEGRQIVDTLRTNGNEAWYLVFKDEGHGFKKKPNNDYFNAAAILFWQKHLLGQ